MAGTGDKGCENNTPWIGTDFKSVQKVENGITS